MIELYKKNIDFVPGTLVLLSFQQSMVFSKFKIMWSLQKVYREDFEKDIKGRSSMDLDKTPEFLHVKYITNLLKEV